MVTAGHSSCFLFDVASVMAVHCGAPPVTVECIIHTLIIELVLLVNLTVSISSSEYLAVYILPLFPLHMYTERETRTD